MQGFLQVILQGKTCTATLEAVGLCYDCNHLICKYHWASATWLDYNDPTGMLWRCMVLRPWLLLTSLVLLVL